MHRLDKRAFGHKSPPWTRGLLSLAALMARPLGAEIESLLPLALPPTFSNVRDSGTGSRMQARTHVCTHARVARQGWKLTPEIPHARHPLYNTVCRYGRV